MSDISDALAELHGTPTSVQESAPSEPSEEEFSFSGVVKSVYEKVPESLRKEVAPYFKEFDTNFTKYAQEVQGKLKTYQGLGDPTDLQEAIAARELLINDPEKVYNWLIEQGFGKKQATEIANQIEDEQNGSVQTDPALMSKLTDLEKIVTAMVASQQQTARQRQEQEELQQFNSMMDELHATHAKDDPNFKQVVTHFIASGLEPDAAVALYAQVTQSAVNNSAAKTRTPTVLSGAGTPPRQNVDVSKLESKDIRDFLTSGIAEIQRMNQ